MMPFAPAAAMARPGAKPQQPRFFASVAVVVLLHAALLWVATAPIKRPLVRDDRVWGQVLQLKAPQAVFNARPLTKQARKQPPVAPSIPRAAAPARPAQESPLSASTDTADSLQALTAPALSETPDPPARAAPSDIRQQALKAVGAIDRQLRAEHPQPLKAPADSQAARLSRGIAAARDAVKPKWFEAARTELISAPNDPKRIYRVTTGMGEYCLYYPDKASISTNSSAASGAANFGQPTAGSCPTAF